MESETWRKYLGDCEHHYCRCMRANELAAMGRVNDAILVHTERVRCRYAFDGERKRKDGTTEKIIFVV